MILETLAPDKARHYIAGNLAGIVGSAVAVIYGYPELAGWSANLGALAAGLLKEGVDWLANEVVRAANHASDVAAIDAGLPLQTPQPLPHSVELADVLATWVGGIQVQTVAWVVAP